MCTGAAEAVKLQCGREYGFTSGEAIRATDLSLLNSNQLEGLPTNNLPAERDLSRFDVEAKVAKCRNRKFKATNIRNNIVLHKHKGRVNVDKMSKKISLILGDRETHWNEMQKKKLAERILMKMKKAAKSKDYIGRLLSTCKSWGGPSTNVNELQHILKSRSDQEEEIVKTEMAFFAHTHKADKIARPNLYRLNQISHEEKKENLAILLNDDEETVTCTIIDLPSNASVMSALQSCNENTDTSQQAKNLHTNELCVVAWLSKNSQYEWYIGYVKTASDNGYQIDHLHRSDISSESQWKYPSKEDIQAADVDQIVDCTVEGAWDISPDKRKRVFTISNLKCVRNAFKNHINS